MVPDLICVVVLFTDTGSQYRNDILDFFAFYDPVESGFFHIQNFTLKGENSLKFSVSSLLGRTTGRISFHQKKFPLMRIRILTFGQFSRQCRIQQRSFAAGKIAGPPGSLSGPGSLNRLFDNFFADGRIFFQKHVQLFIDQRFNQPLDLAVSQLGLGLTFELGRFDSYADNGGQPFPNIISADFGLKIFGQAAAGCILIQGPGQGCLESDQMGSAFNRVDIVCKGKQFFIIGIVVLNGDFDTDFIFNALNKNRRVKRRIAPVQIFHKRNQPSLVLQFLFNIRAFILKGNLDAFIQKSQFSETAQQNIKIKRDNGKYFRVCGKVNLGSPFVCCPPNLKLAGLFSLCVSLIINFAFRIDFQFNEDRQSVDDRNTNAMKPSGNLIGTVVKFSAGMKFCHDDFDSRNIFLFVNSDRNASAIIFNADAVIQVNDYLDIIAISGHGFIDAVIYNLVDQMMKPFNIHVPDIHGRSFANSLQTFQYFDIIRSIRLIFHFILFYP